jgi:hypothetical protein
MVEIHELQVHLLTSKYVCHNTTLSSKKINVDTAIFIRFKSGYQRDIKIIKNN